LAHRAAEPAAVPDHHRVGGKRHPASGRAVRAAKERLPGATFTILPDVGHGSMVDDPELVARTILAVIGAAEK
jgi:pimeloyl-ACP methyl ester carboxylesterase